MKESDAGLEAAAAPVKLTGAVADALAVDEGATEEELVATVVAAAAAATEGVIGAGRTVTMAVALAQW